MIFIYFERALKGMFSRINLALASISVCALTLIGCATEPPPPPHVFIAKYEKQALPDLPTNTNNEVTGRAFLMTNGGIPRTCAGGIISIRPISLGLSYAVSDYEKEVRSLPANVIRASQLDREYVNFRAGLESIIRTYSKSRICDIDGSFRFSGLPSGEYLLTTQIIWQVPDIESYVELSTGRAVTRYRPVMKDQGGEVTGRVDIPSNSQNRTYESLVTRLTPFSIPYGYGLGIGALPRY